MEEKFNLWWKEKSFVVFLTIASFMLILFGLANIILFIPYLGIIEVILGIVLLIDLVLFNFGKLGFSSASNLFLLTLFFCFSLLLLTGGIKGTGIFWIFTFPLVSFFLKNFRTAAIWNLLFVAVLFLILILSSQGFQITPYNQITLLQAITVYTTILLLTYIYCLNKCSFGEL